MTHRINSVLETTFGHTSFRGDQEAVINAALSGKHTMVLMPTGMGKSLCFQIPARILEGLTVVVSPLIALMKDQVDQARKKGFRCVAINSSQSKEERVKSYEQLAECRYEMIYVTPERFRKSDFLEALGKNKIALLAVDEAHCISQWGHDFRPDYSRLREIRRILKNPTTMALTATATPEVRKDIVFQLGLTEDEVLLFDRGLERPNLAVSVQEVYGIDEKIRGIIGLRHQFPGPAIVYCALISTIEKISGALNRMGIEHRDYHGNLPENIRKRNQEWFLKTQDGLMLATPAFGLGVDKPNIRLVVHAEVPGSLESYYQEIGRAGRDGLDASGVLLLDNDDLAIQMDFIKWANPDVGFYERLYNLLKNNLSRANIEGLDYLRRELNFYNSRDYRLETALNMLERWDAIQIADNYKRFEIVGPLPDEVQNEDHNENRKKASQMRLYRMMEWTKSEECRMLGIYSYFGHQVDQKCGRCDKCL